MIEVEEAVGGAETAVTAFSPETAFWSVTLYNGRRELEELAQLVLSTLGGEYPQLEVDAATADPGGRYPDPPGAVGYDVSFSYVDLLSSASVRAFHHGEQTYLVLSQAEDHEFPQVEPVFRAMTLSLIAS